ncbi:MAG: heavy-metal-associated domain-containing protein [Bdellovibrionales bacterium]|nr:heavy-metal-associated domain-containing protein [Bdellovibrionales bacterium]
MNSFKKYLGIMIIFASLGYSPSWAGDSATRVTVEGMTCSSCADSVKKSLLQHPEVKAVDVDVKTGKVVVTFQPEKSLTDAQISESIQGAGYKVKKITKEKKT